MEFRFHEEERLLEEARQGDTRAFDRLFFRHQDRLRAGVRGLLENDRELIEETVSRAFLRAYVAFPGFRQESSFSTWLFRIAIREAQDLKNSEYKAHQYCIYFDYDQKVRRADILDPILICIQQEENGRVRRALSALPEPYQTPVRLRYIDTLTSVEIARRLERPEGTVRYQISRGLQILRERFIG